MKATRLMLVFAVLAAAPVAMAQSPKDLAAEAKIRKVLDRIVIPKLEFHEATLQEVLDFLINEIRRRDPHGGGIPMMLEIRPQFGPPSPPDDAPKTAPEDAKFTVTLTNIPLIEALKYVTGLSNTKFWIRPDGIHIVDWSEPEPMFTRDFRISPDFFPAYEREDRLDHTKSAAQIKKDFRAYLIDNGVALPAGATATLSEAATRLTVRTTKDQFGLIQQILKTERPPAAFSVPEPEMSKVIEGPPKTADSGWKNAETEPAKKMRTIILPRVSLENVNLYRVVNMLSEMSVRYDPKSPQSKRGVRIMAMILTESPGYPPNVSYAATNVSLFEAVRAIARLTRSYVQIRPNMVQLVPAHSDKPVLTRTYLLAPTTAAQMARWPEFINQDIPVPWLRDNGVNLLSNGNATYMPKRHYLIVTDTEAMQRAIQEQNEKAWREYYAVEKAKKDKTR